MLKPSAAVLMITPGIWGWKCNSLMSVCPWWMNSSCGGRSFKPPPPVPAMPAASSSASTERSQTVSWLSAPDAASIDSSVGCHSIDVIGPCREGNKSMGKCFIRLKLVPTNRVKSWQYTKKNFEQRRDVPLAYVLCHSHWCNTELVRFFLGGQLMNTGSVELRRGVGLTNSLHFSRPTLRTVDGIFIRQPMIIMIFS